MITDELLQRFLQYVDRPGATETTYRANLQHFRAWCLYEGIDKPEAPDLARYRAWLMQEHDSLILDPEAPEGWAYRTHRDGSHYTVTCKAATVRGYLQSIALYYKWTAESGIYPNIAAGLHMPRQTFLHKRDALEGAAVMEIDNSIRQTYQEQAAGPSTQKTGRAIEQGKRLRAMYLLAVTCGLRTIEISRARVGDLETIGGQTWLYIWGKGRPEADEKKPLAPEVAEALREYLEARQDPFTAVSPLFVSTGNRSGGQRIAATTISRMLKRALQGAGYDSSRLTAQSLRHTAGTSVQRITGDLYATQRYMRHSNPATTEIYLHLDQTQEEARTAKRLYEYYKKAHEEEARRES